MSTQLTTKEDIMSKPIIVQVTQGKHESVDYAGVKLFDTLQEAEKFMAENNTGKQKHWKNCIIVESGELMELQQPDWIKGD